MNKSNRSVIFVGSSTEGLPAARALQQNLDHDAEVILWSQGVFGLSSGTLETLVTKSQQFDFAVLVLTPDDLRLSRGNEDPSPRDNVVFELGLFMGALGRERTYIVYDRTAGIQLPSDLAGVTSATYEPPQAGSLQSALGAPSSEIFSAIQTLGPRQRASDEVYIDQTTQFKVIAGLLDIPGAQLFILMHTAGAILHREVGLSLGMRQEYHITSEHHTGSGHGYLDVKKFCEQLADAGLLTADLRGRIGLSERGHAFAEWLDASEYRAEYFWCDIGTWGTRPESWQNRDGAKTMPRNIIELQQRRAEEESKAAENQSSDKADL
ncbi:nucleotide-binding protein [Kiritimatiellaeota bacterium B1221]|nr:nucleotide-binding protein [Kiritimatiellaeota bacterium B1221]